MTYLPHPRPPCPCSRRWARRRPFARCSLAWYLSRRSVNHCHATQKARQQTFGDSGFSSYLAALGWLRLSGDGLCRGVCETRLLFERLRGIGGRQGIGCVGHCPRECLRSHGMRRVKWAQRARFWLWRTRARRERRVVDDGNWVVMVFRWWVAGSWWCGGRRKNRSVKLPQVSTALLKKRGRRHVKAPLTR